MTPEQLEAIEGIGPKTVEKISLAVNNYFASLEQGAPVEGGIEAEVAVDGEVATAEASEPASEDITAEVACGDRRRHSRGRCACRGENEPQAEASEEQPASGSGIRLRNQRIMMTRWHKFDGVGPKKLTP